MIGLESVLIDCKTTGSSRSTDSRAPDLTLKTKNIFLSQSHEKVPLFKTISNVPRSHPLPSKTPTKPKKNPKKNRPRHSRRQSVAISFFFVFFFFSGSAIDVHPELQNPFLKADRNLSSTQKVLIVSISLHIPSPHIFSFARFQTSPSQSPRNSNHPPLSTPRSHFFFFSKKKNKVTSLYCVRHRKYSGGTPSSVWTAGSFCLSAFFLLVVLSSFGPRHPFPPRVPDAFDSQPCDPGDDHGCAVPQVCRESRGCHFWPSTRHRFRSRSGWDWRVGLLRPVLPRASRLRRVDCLHPGPPVLALDVSGASARTIRIVSF
jgi:hypothetical protein